MSHCNGHRWSKFWWRDHQGDAALRACSLAARGYWMELLCIAHEATPVGHVLLNGRRPTSRQMAAIAGCSEAQVKRLENELEAAGVFDKLDDDTIVCRRMVRDEQVSEAGRAHVAKRWKDTEKPENPNSPPTSIPISQPTREPSGQAYRHPNSDPFTRSRRENQKAEEREGKAPLSSPRVPLPQQSSARADGVCEPPRFDAFWETYPRKVGRRAAETAFVAAIKRGNHPDDILDGLKRTQFSPEPRFQPHATTWLNGDRWLDEPARTLREEWNLPSFLLDDEPPMRPPSVLLS